MSADPGSAVAPGQNADSGCVHWLLDQHMYYGWSVEGTFTNSGSRPDSGRFDVLDSGCFEVSNLKTSNTCVSLGITYSRDDAVRDPLLCFYNPRIDWAMGVIREWSSICIYHPGMEFYLQRHLQTFLDPCPSSSAPDLTGISKLLSSATAVPFELLQDTTIFSNAYHVIHIR